MARKPVLRTPSQPFRPATEFPIHLQLYYCHHIRHTYYYIILSSLLPRVVVIVVQVLCVGIYFAEQYNNYYYLIKTRRAYRNYFTSNHTIHILYRSNHHKCTTLFFSFNNEFIQILYDF